MSTTEKPIRLSYHAKEQAYYRGCCETEIIDTIHTSSWIKAKLGKLECRKDFIFNGAWNNKKYKTKQVRPIFTEETNEIIVVTVYVYYF